MRRPIPKPWRENCPWLAILLAGWWMCGPMAMQAQHWSDGLLPGADWTAAFDQFDSTWQDSIPEKGKGFKPFMRWREFAEKRFAFEGSEEWSPNAPWQATQWEREGRAARTQPLDTLWRSAVPAGVPLVGGAGRVNRVVVHPLDTSRWLACAPSGGLWQSQTSGNSWSLMGTQDWAGMGVSDAAFHPNDPDCILAATGDSDFGSAYAIGLMQTCDGGNTWSPTGLQFEMEQTLTCSRVHRKAGDPQQILVATGDGIWLSEDDGVTFSKTLEGVCSDLIPHPGDSAVWHAALRPGELFRSTDGGRHWESIPGMPSAYLASRYVLATTPADPSLVAAIASKSGSQGLLGLYLSTDSGATFSALPDLPNLLGWTADGSDLGGQGFYDLALAVDPTDPHHMVAGGVNLWETWDGGVSWNCTGHWFGGGEAPYVHADHHAVTFIPGTSDWVSAHDGGVNRLGAAQNLDLSEGLEVGQVYRLAWSEAQPNQLLSGAQDNGINLLKDGVHAQVIGADGFHCLIDPDAPDNLIASEYFGKAHRSTDGGWSWAPWILSNGDGVNEQGDWNTPLAQSPLVPNRIHVAKHRVYWTDDAGMSWGQTQALPGNEIEVLALSFTEDSILAVAKGSFAFITHDLDQWTPLTGLPGMPVQDLLFDAGSSDVLWMAFGGYSADDRIWQSLDGGDSWDSFSEGLPALPVNALTQDPESGDLYAGTDAGVYVRPAGSSSWTPYKSGLPEVLCSDIGIRQSTGELLLATYGRGLWKAPLHTPPARDAGIVAIHGTKAVRCSGPLSVATEVRNCGSDTLVAVSLLWNGTDTVTYGMLLPPNAETSLNWPNSSRAAVPAGDQLVVRIVNVVGADGNWSQGTMESGFDDVPENDVLGATWEHREGTGWVTMSTLADCNPRESAWAIADTTGEIQYRRQHFPIELAIMDSLCLGHGCYEVVLHDQSQNGFAGPQCGSLGSMELLSATGDTIWSLLDPSSAGVAFSSGLGGSFCLPMAGWVGCTEPGACNFNPAASVDDGTCIMECHDAQPCPEDLDGDGLYGATDILAVLSEFGCMSGCSMDITGDGTVSANDVLALLALYGESCVP